MPTTRQLAGNFLVKLYREHYPGEETEAQIWEMLDSFGRRTGAVHLGISESVRCFLPAFKDSNNVKT